MAEVDPPTPMTHAGRRARIPPGTRQRTGRGLASGLGGNSMHPARPPATGPAMATAAVAEAAGTHPHRPAMPAPIWEVLSIRLRAASLPRRSSSLHLAGWQLPQLALVQFQDPVQASRKATIMGNQDQ